tara:strand:- start:55 stop:801 length:747 start_codon:yes stop_codon:yes gene_type:complete
MKRSQDLGISEFLKTGLDLKSHLSQYLKLSSDALEKLLPQGSDNLASIHPGALIPEESSAFYEEIVGTAHLIDLGAWHLSSADYIADTLKLQQMFAHGHVLDFGGGIGTHALAAASLPQVDHVWFVDLNPENRKFVSYRAEMLGLNDFISCHRDIKDLKRDKFQTLVCLDVLEHLPNPSEQLLIFESLLDINAIALMNWYFFKGYKGEFPFHFDDPKIIEEFFLTLQEKFIEVFHPLLITARAYKKKI